MRTEAEKQDLRDTLLSLHYQSYPKNPGILLTYRALATRVLMVASVNIEVLDWAAYCAVVPGIRHHLEVSAALERGDKISLELATVLFPFFAENLDWRD